MDLIARALAADPGRVAPDYAGGSILDLVGWTAGRVDTRFEPAGASLRGAPAGEASRIALVLFDGLGDRYLRAHGAGSALHCARQGTLTSVFPSTTASAITTLMTGLAPAAHGLIGWTCRGHRGMGLFEPLPLVYADGGAPVRGPLRLRRLFPYDTLYQRLRAPCMVLTPSRLVDSDFSRRHSRGAKVAGYDRLEELPELLALALGQLPGRGLVYAYVPHFDALAHDDGMAAATLALLFERLDRCFAALDRCCRAAGAGLVATADHGLIDAPEAEMICLGASPELAAMLALPPWGERRAAFCALRRGAGGDFAAALEARWPGCCDLYPAAEVLASGLFGPGPAHVDLATRVGDVLILPRGGATLVGASAPAAVHAMRAVHGGLAADEMEVPLLVAGAL